MTHPIRISDFFVIRTPRLDFKQLTDWSNSDKKILREYLRRWLEQPETQEALYIASPSILERIDQWYSDPDSKRGQKMELALAKYFIRMAGRATPFGLFSSLGLGSIGNETSLAFDKDDELVRKTRIDMMYLLSIKSYITTEEWELHNLKLVKNSSLYKLGKEYRYIESYRSKKDIHYRLSSVEASPYLDKLIEYPSSVLSVDKIIACLKAYDEELTKEEIQEYIKALVQEDIMQPWLPLPITGAAPDAQLLKSLEDNDITLYAAPLAKSLVQLNDIDKSYSNPVACYQEIYQSLKELPFEIDESKLFQVDMYRTNNKLQLDKSSLEGLTNVLAKLSRLASPKKNPLSSIINKIENDYVGRLVPVKKLLDDETGWSLTSNTGHAAPLLKDINLRKTSSFEKSLTLRPLDRLLIDVMTNNEVKCPKEIIITDELVDKYASQRGGSMPLSFAAIIEAYCDKQGKPIYCHRGCYGPSSANLLGRFCHLSSDLLEKAREAARYEERINPHVIYAEIVHLPAGRVGNIIARPCIREHEIPFMAESAVDKELQISLDELYVFVENGNVKLWSDVKQCEIVPRLSSAHNFSSRSLGIYTFLSRLQGQATTPPDFSWPEFFYSMAYLPRVRMGDIILSKRSWKIKRERFVELSNSEGQEFNNKLALLKSEFDLPDWVSFGASDNTLTLNLSNPIMLNVLLGETNNHKVISFEEILESEFDSIVQQNGKPLRNEIIVPLFCEIKDDNDDNDELVKFIETRKKDMKNKTSQQDSRNFPPGSEWLSIKIYAGNSTVEKFVLAELSSFLENTQLAGDIEKYFFIRYSDPDWHLRLRLNGDPKILLGKVMPKLYNIAESHIKDGPIKNIVIDTYSQEVERYGGKKAIHLAETAFWINSETSIKLLNIVHLLSDDYRWRSVLLGCDSLLSGFGFDLNEKIEIISKVRDGFGREFGENSDMRKRLGKKFRAYEKDIMNDFSENIDDAVINQLKMITTAQELRLQEISNLYRELEETEELTTPLVNILPAFLHMFNNRMFKAYGRQQEFVVYDMLRRYYEKQIKRH